MVGHFPGSMELGGDDAQPGLGAALTSCVDGCLGTFQLWGSVPCFPMAATAIAPTFQTGGPAAAQIEHLAPRVAPYRSAWPAPCLGPDWQGSSVIVHFDNMGGGGWGGGSSELGYSEVPLIMHLLWC